MHLGTAEWIGIISLIVLGVIGIATILATRQFGNRRRRATLIWKASSLMPDGHRQGLLRVTFGDVLVPDPHLLSVKLRNTGPADITSSHFDRNTPFTVTLNATVYGLTDVSDPTRTEMDVSSDSTIVSLSPTLLRRGEEWSFEVIVEGTPHPEFTSALIDTDVATIQASDFSERRRDFNIAIAVAGGAATLASLIVAISTIFLTHNSPATGPPLTTCSISRPSTGSHTRSYTEVAGGIAHTFSNPCTAGGVAGSDVQAFAAVQVSCAQQGFSVADGNEWWYQLAGSPWRSNFYVSADGFYNNGGKAGSLIGTPFVDPAVPPC